MIMNNQHDMKWANEIDLDAILTIKRFFFNDDLIAASNVILSYMLTFIVYCMI